MGKNQRAILAALSRGDTLMTRQIAACIASNEADAARQAVVGLMRQGVQIEVGRVGAGREVQNTYRLLPFADKPWLPVWAIPIFMDLMYRKDMGEGEVRGLVEDHVATVQRRMGRAA